MAAPTRLHGVTATPVRIRSTQKHKYRVYLLLCFWSQQMQALCAGGHDTRQISDRRGAAKLWWSLACVPLISGTYPHTMHPSRPALEPTQPPIQWVPGLSRG